MKEKEKRMKQGSIDWKLLAITALEGGCLCTLLKRIPHERWNDRRHGQCEGLLYLACRGNDLNALRMLLAHGLNPNAFLNLYSPLWLATHKRKIHHVRLLLAAGAWVTPKILHKAISDPRNHQVARLYIACGYRLEKRMASPLRAYERDVLALRFAVVALLTAKDRARLWQWDRFLLRCIARELWSERF